MNSNTKTGALYVEQLDPAFVEIIDQNADGNTYFGAAEAGSATSDAKWRIQRMSTSGNTNTFKYANGLTSFSQVWDNRTSLTY